MHETKVDAEVEDRDDPEDQGPEDVRHGDLQGGPETSGPGRITVQFVGDDAEPVEEGTADDPVRHPEEPESDPDAVSDEPVASPQAASQRPQTDGAPMIERSEIESEDPDDPEAFGRWLRNQRELRGIRLRAIADSSKISLGYLRALESGRFDILPAEVFTKGFLRQYARYVGLDPEEAINFYLAARDQVEPVELDPMLIPNPPKEPSGARWVVVALVLAALLLGVVWFLGRLSEERSEGDEEAETPNAAVSVPADAVPADTVAADTGRADAGPGDAAAAAADPDSDGATPTASAQTAAPDAAAQTAPLRVVLDFSDTCWVSAVIDGGETREKVHAQGESLTLDARESIELKVGNYRAVEVQVNGIPYDLRSRGRSNTVVRTVRIDLDSLASPGSPADAGAAD